MAHYMSEITNEKKVVISGTLTRYQMKKVIKNPEDVKERKTMDRVSLEMFSWENQLSLLNMFSTKKNEDSSVILVKKQISSKLNNYKQQDVFKKVYDERKLINMEQVICKLQESGLKCLYCKEEVYLLYKIVREMKQWTLDRIDNDIGHFYDNVVISCLDCNLKRRKKNSNAFLFTKQMNIVRVDHSVGEDYEGVNSGDIELR
uniref:HNH domain-containing protein n=1 Tax=viral metagenome TaxID=1070528 RepID=A0A6C0BVS2_9ZZZZ